MNKHIALIALTTCIAAQGMETTVQSDDTALVSARLQQNKKLITDMHAQGTRVNCCAVAAGVFALNGIKNLMQASTVTDDMLQVMDFVTPGDPRMSCVKLSWHKWGTDYESCNASGTWLCNVVYPAATTRSQVTFSKASGIINVIGFGAAAAGAVIEEVRCRKARKQLAPLLAELEGLLKEQDTTAVNAPLYQENGAPSDAKKLSQYYQLVSHVGSAHAAKYMCLLIAATALINMSFDAAYALRYSPGLMEVVDHLTPPQRVMNNISDPDLVVYWAKNVLTEPECDFSIGESLFSTTDVRGPITLLRTTASITSILNAGILIGSLLAAGYHQHQDTKARKTLKSLLMELNNLTSDISEQELTEQ